MYMIKYKHIHKYIYKYSETLAYIQIHMKGNMYIQIYIDNVTTVISPSTCLYICSSNNLITFTVQPAAFHDTWCL